MPSTVVKGIEAVSPGVGATPVYEGVKASATAFAIGTVVVYTSGLLVRAAADVTTGVVGVVTMPAVSGDTAIQYVPALSHVIFEGTLEDETNNNHALVATNRGLAYALQRDTTNDRWYLDENDTANAAARIIRFKDAIGTVKARVYFSFLNSVTIFA